MIDEQLLDQSHLILHEIFIESLANVTALTVVLDRRVQSKERDNFWTVKVLIQQTSWVLFVLSDIVNIDSSCSIDDSVEDFVEGLV